VKIKPIGVGSCIGGMWYHAWIILNDVLTGKSPSNTKISAAFISKIGIKWDA
jgi:hypothetical protein